MSWSKYILDSSALLSVAYREPGAELVKSLLGRSVVSSVNLAEAIGKMSSRGIPASDAAATLIEMTPGVIAFDQDIAVIAGEMASSMQPFGLSLGDRACLATAMHLKLEAVTADKIWGKLKLPIKIKVIR